MSTVVLQNIEKRYGEHVAVSDFNLSIKQGELVALLGPSGCGKTTTLRMVAGFVDATAGSIAFGDRDVTLLAPYHRNTGMVFQSYALFPHLNVAENVAFGLRRRGVSRADIEKRVAVALDRVRLGSLKDRMPKNLSGGQQQRVALARALVIEPDVLLLDEPLSNLDAKLREEMRVEIRQIQQSLGLTTIFVTHDQEEALSVADRLVVMNVGRIEQIGTPFELYEKPGTEFVATFIGGANILKGRSEGMAFVLADGTRLPLAGGDTPCSVLAVRPERIAIAAGAASPAPSDTCSLPGNITVRTYLGAVVEYIVTLATGESLRVREHGRGSAQDLPKPGDTVTLTWPASASIRL
jgi:putative spermidine/putrescine transport system ATP-binding protein